MTPGGSHLYGIETRGEARTVINPFTQQVTCHFVVTMKTCNEKGPQCPVPLLCCPVAIPMVVFDRSTHSLQVSASCRSDQSVAVTPHLRSQSRSAKELFSFLIRLKNRWKIHLNLIAGPTDLRWPHQWKIIGTSLIEDWTDAIYEDGVELLWFSEEWIIDRKWLKCSLWINFFRLFLPFFEKINSLLLPPPHLN